PGRRDRRRAAARARGEELEARGATARAVRARDRSLDRLSRDAAQPRAGEAAGLCAARSRELPRQLAALAPAALPRFALLRADRELQGRGAAPARPVPEGDRARARLVGEG